MSRLQCALLVTVAAIGFASVATAADMPVKARPMPVAAVYNWTGFYVGGNVGYSWGNSDTDTFFNNAPFFSITHPDALRLNGIVGGGQVGFNWQATPTWVFGVEADWQASDEKASGSVSDPFAVPFVSVGTVTTSYEAKISSFGTLRGRVGYTWDRLLVYGTAGLAYGQVKLSGTTNESGVSVGGPFNLSTPFSSSESNTGWVAGAGIEGAIVNSWSWKAEYLYVDLGSLDVTTPNLNFGGTNTVHTKFTDNIIRGGINYRF